MKNFNTNTDNEQTWFTPKYITDSLGTFDLDPCSSACRPWDIAISNMVYMGLDCDWWGRVWLNPPYGKETFKWIEKLAEHGDGIALIFARTETKGFHEQVWNKADAVFFFKGRISFYRKDGTKAGPANAPSCLIAYGENNIKALEDSNLNGKLVRLK